MKFTKIIFINILLFAVLSSTGIGQDMITEAEEDLSSGFTQDMQQIMLIIELEGKSVTTYGDALRMFGFQAETSSGSYRLKGYNDYSKLTKGMVSLMAAKYLYLKKSLLYRIIETERYAYRACVAEKLFSADGSENDLMSGPELIEFFAKVGEFRGRR